MTQTHTEQSLPRQLFSMTWPMLFGVLSLMSFQLADSVFIGRLGVEPLAAVGFTIPVYQLIIGIQVGLGIATTAVISRSLGANKIAHAKHLAGMVLLIGASTIMLTCLTLWVFREQIMSLLGAEKSLYPVIELYWLPWLVSAWFGALLYFGYSIFRSHGNTLLPGLVMVVCSLLNIVLDPVFIFILDLGLQGAPLASIASFAIGWGIIFPKLFKKGMVELHKDRDAMKSAIRQITSILGPATIGQFLPGLSSMIATAIVAGFGATVVAAWGLGTRMEFFSIVIVLALTMSLPPMVGKLLGQKDFTKVDQLVSLSIKFVLMWQFVIAILWFVSSEFISNLLTNEAEVAITVNHYLSIIPFSYGFLGICMIMISVCNALGAPLKALIISMIRLFICYVPCLWLGAYLHALEGLFVGALIGNLLAGGLSIKIYKNTLQHVLRKHAVK